MDFSTNLVQTKFRSLGGTKLADSSEPIIDELRLRGLAGGGVGSLEGGRSAILTRISTGSVGMTKATVI